MRVVVFVKNLIARPAVVCLVPAEGRISSITSRVDPSPGPTSSSLLWGAVDRSRLMGGLYPSMHDKDAVRHWYLVLVNQTVKRR